ncbi:MAG: circularly permuted type 2 ATP-grasp protein [Candidatus Omnitrophica bacterium]|nr:circularly permuted type 2 ATP-grasp protein [Candidatus Omnitrophota bacterium]
MKAILKDSLPEGLRPTPPRILQDNTRVNSPLFGHYHLDNFYDEMVSDKGDMRHWYQLFADSMCELGFKEVLQRQRAAEKAFMSMGITFNVYRDGAGIEKIFPFDIIPRIIDTQEWDHIERGLEQRIRALNLFIQDIYGSKTILKDGVIPSDIIFSSPGYLKECEGLRPAHGIWAHISGIDIIKHSDGINYVLEDNLRVPSGVSYVLGNREIMKSTFPEVLEHMEVRPVNDYPLRLHEILEHLSSREKPTVVVLTPGIYNSAYFEHSFLAQQMGVELVEGRDLVVQDNFVYMRTTRGFKRVDVIYRRIDDTYLDPKIFNPDSVLGVPGLFDVYKRGNVALANAPGTGVADDKVVYAYVPKMIKYYFSEDPILPNVPTYMCWDEKDREYVLAHIGQMVVKAANQSGGYGMLVGPHATKKDQAVFRDKIRKFPREYIAQPTMALSRIPTIIEEQVKGRHVDLRPYILCGREVYVLPGGLTRVALREGSLVVNSSQGGGSKDTWVLR